jgi:hypothetical protein
MNAFFLYRKQYKERIQALYQTSKSHEISRIAGECWAQESPLIKNHFRRMSQELYEQQREEELQELIALHTGGSAERPRSQSLPFDSLQSLEYTQPIAMLRPPYDINPALVSRDILEITGHCNQFYPMMAAQSPVVPLPSPIVSTSSPRQIATPLPTEYLDPLFDSQQFCQSPVCHSIDSLFVDDFIPRNPYWSNSY